MGFYGKETKMVVEGFKASLEYEDCYKKYEANKTLINYENLSKAYANKQNKNIWNQLGLFQNECDIYGNKPKNSTFNLIVNSTLNEKDSETSKSKKEVYSALNKMFFRNEFEKPILPLLNMDFEVMIIARNNRQEKFENFQNQLIQYKLDNHTPEEVEIAEGILSSVKKRMDEAIATENELTLKLLGENEGKKIVAEIGRSTAYIPSNLAYQVENVKRQRRYEQEEKEEEEKASRDAK